MIILGAGMAGCLAGVLNPNAVIYERSRFKDDVPVHRAVLRFRTNKIAKICGMEFEKVIVRKSIYHDGKEYRTPTLKLANMYSRKVSGGYYSRSILNLEDVERYIAPENFHSILLGFCNDKIVYDSNVTRITGNSIWTTPGKKGERSGIPIISTLPMPVLLSVVCGMTYEKGVVFRKKKIRVMRFRLGNSDIFQTIYYPDPYLNVYRASIIRDLLIVECVNNGNFNVDIVLESFGLEMADVTYCDEGEQLGKIAPIPEEQRKELILKLTMAYNIYSLGRFSVWRNILLDDVYEDILKIRKLIDNPRYDTYLYSAIGDKNHEERKTES